MTKKSLSSYHAVDADRQRNSYIFSFLGYSKCYNVTTYQLQ